MSIGVSHPVEVGAAVTVRGVVDRVDFVEGPHFVEEVIVVRFENCTSRVDRREIVTYEAPVPAEVDVRQILVGDVVFWRRFSGAWESVDLLFEDWKALVEYARVEGLQICKLNVGEQVQL